jgi:hypothetical protein
MTKRMTPEIFTQMLAVFSSSVSGELLPFASPTTLTNTASGDDKAYQTTLSFLIPMIVN